MLYQYIECSGELGWLIGGKMVVATIIIYFQLYPWTGVETAIAVTAGTIGILVVIGFIAFETEQAVEKWKKLTKNE